MADAVNITVELAQQLIMALQQAGAAAATTQLNPAAAVAAKECLSP